MHPCVPCGYAELIMSVHHQTIWFEWQFLLAFLGPIHIDTYGAGASNCPIPKEPRHALVAQQWMDSMAIS